MGICWRVLLRPCLLAKSFYSRQFAACDMIPSTPQYASSLRLRKHLDASKSKVKGMLGVPRMLRGWWSSNRKPTCEDSGGSDGSHRFPGAGKQQVRSFIAIDLCALPIFFFRVAVGGLEGHDAQQNWARAGEGRDLPSISLLDVRMLKYPS